jgi:hypothetical protein
VGLGHEISSGVLEESPNDNLELGQNVRESQLLLGREDLDGIVGAKDVTSFPDLIEDAHDGYSGFQILAYLGQDAPPTVSRRADLEDQFGDYGQVSLGGGARRDAVVTVERDIRPAHRVRILFGDDAGIVADEMPQGMIFKMSPQQIVNLTADFAMPRRRQVHEKHPPAFQFLGLSIVR